MSHLTREEDRKLVLFTFFSSLLFQFTPRENNFLSLIHSKMCGISLIIGADELTNCRFVS